MNRYLVIIPVLALSLGLAACDDPAPGPAEQAGRQIDRAGERIRDAVDPPRGPVERAGRAIDRAVD
jgi:predicted small secreted protein